MNYATERLLSAAEASLASWKNEEQSVREEHREQIEELEAAIHYFNAHGRAKPCVLINMDGGLVHDIIATDPGIEAVVIDYDIDGADRSELFDIPQDDGTRAEAFRSKWGELGVDRQFITGALAAEPTKEA